MPSKETAEKQNAEFELTRESIDACLMDEQKNTGASVGRKCQPR